MTWKFALTFLLLVVASQDVSAQNKDEDLFLMSIGGYSKQGGYTSNYEILPLFGQALPTCLTFSESKYYPQIVVDLASGILPDNTILGCGGTTWTTDCYSYDVGTQKWTKTGVLAAADQNVVIKRNASIYIASASHADWGVVLSGGQLGGGDLNDMMELTTDGTEFKQLAPLPVATRSHCMVILNDKKVFVTGGIDASNPTAASFMYDRTNNKWSRVKDMPSSRLYHHCSTIMNPDTSEMEVIVAGGFTPTKKVWIYTPSSDSWRKGPSLPQYLYGGAVVTIDNSRFAIAGGFRKSAGIDDVLMYDNGVWRKLEGKKDGGGKVELEKKLGFRSAVLVDVSKYPECQ